MELLKLQILFILHESNHVLKMYDQILFKSVSIASLVGAWAIQQISDIEPIISQGFDQLFSIGLLVVAVIVIWKAFAQKDANETQLLKDQVARAEEEVRFLKKLLADEHDINDELREDAKKKD